MRRPEFIAKHGGMPSGWLGRLVASIMERETTAINQDVITLLDPKEGEAVLEISLVSLGRVHLLSFPGELFSTVTAAIETHHGEPVVVVSFADGVSGYLLPEADFEQRGYEWTWALFKPQSVSGLRRAAQELLAEHVGRAATPD